MEYSYGIVSSAFQFLNKLLTIHNFSIHPLLFLSVEELLSFYENVLLHLYNKKKDMNEELYIFIEKCNHKHKDLYAKLVNRIWNVYLMITSEEFQKKGSSNEGNLFFSRFSINGNSSNENEKTVECLFKVHDLEFPKEYKEFLIHHIDITYKSSLIKCISKCFRVLGQGYFMEEFYFCSHNELLARDIFMVNKIIEDTNRTFNGGNLKFLMNFLYPLLNHYIGLYEKEEDRFKKNHFFSYVKNILVHFTCCLNDCINLYYFLSTNIEDLFVMVAKFISCQDYDLLLYFLKFVEFLFLSTLRYDKVQSMQTTVAIKESLKNVHFQYTSVNYMKNNFFVRQIAEPILQLVLPKYTALSISMYEQKFGTVKQQKQYNQICASVEEFANIIQACAFFISQTHLNELLDHLRQLIIRTDTVEKELFSVLTLSNIIRLVIPFFSIDQIHDCFSNYAKLDSLTQEILQRKEQEWNRQKEISLKAINKIRKNEEKQTITGRKKVKGKVIQKGKQSGIKGFHTNSMKDKIVNMIEKRKKKEENEKIQFVRIVIFDNIATLFTHFGNILCKGKRSLEKNYKTEGSYKLSELTENEICILNHIYVNNRLEDEQLPVVLQKRSLCSYFENSFNYNISKYVKKFYHYVDSFSYYLKECFSLDRAYCEDLFINLFPKIMKSLFFVNKKFVTKCKRHCLFDNLLKIGTCNMKFLLSHISAGLLLEETICKKVSGHFLYVMIKNYPIEYKRQKELMELFLTLCKKGEEKLLKMYVSFLLVSLKKFHKDIIVNRIDEIIQIINTLSFVKFRHLIRRLIQKIMIYTNPHLLNNVLSKNNRKILKKIMKEESKKKETQGKGTEGTYIQEDLSDEDSDINDASSDSLHNIQNDEMHSKNKNKHKTSKKVDKMKNKELSKKNKQRNLSNFYSTLKGVRTESELEYVQKVISSIFLKKTQNKKRGSSKSKPIQTKYVPSVCSILNNLQTNLLKKDGSLQLSWMVSRNTAVETSHEDKFHLIKKNKVRKNKKEKEDALSDSGEEEGTKVRISETGRIIVPSDSLKHNRMRKKDFESIYKGTEHIATTKYVSSKMETRSKRKQKKELFITADKSIYKSKKGKGDIIKKNKLMPYSYVALNPLMTRSKFRTTTLKTFKNIKSNKENKRLR